MCPSQKGVGEGTETVIETNPWMEAHGFLLRASSEVTQPPELFLGAGCALAAAQAAGPIMMMTHMCVALSIWRGGVCAHGDQRTD